jgi:hypothetical protein
MVHGPWSIVHSRRNKPKELFLLWTISYGLTAMD